MNLSLFRLARRLADYKGPFHGMDEDFDKVFAWTDKERRRRFCEFEFKNYRNPMCSSSTDHGGMLLFLNLFFHPMRQKNKMV